MIPNARKSTARLLKGVRQDGKSREPYRPPSPNGPQTDRDARGRFVNGNRASRGNPLAGEVARNRSRLFKIVRTSDIDLAIKTIRRVLKRGKDCDRLRAVEILLGRILGPPLAFDVLERLARIESSLELGSTL
jgi:hypothetical protein